MGESRGERSQRRCGTIGANVALINTFETFRKKRHVTGYERAGSVSDAEAEAMRQLATEVRDRVIAWLRTHHRHLVGK